MNAPASNPASRPGYRGVVLAMLLLVYTFNFLDRQILGILAKPIMEDLHLTKTEFGAIGGLAFAILYSVLGVPLAYLADRTSRSGVIAGALAVWSAFTGLCGIATGYWQLFLFRLGVGVGEAGGVAPSYAVIADYFPPERRARALGIYSLGIPIGLALGTLLGAYIAALVNWRAAFITMGVIGLVIAPIFRWVVRDVPRPPAREGTAGAPVSAVFGILAGKPAFWLLAFGASCSSLCGYGLALWTPLVLMGNFGFDLVATGQFMASLLLIGGTAGVFAGGWFADRLGKGDRAWYAWLPAIAWLLTAPLFAIGFLTSNPWIAWPLLIIPNGLNILWLGPVTTAVQHMVPQHMRATASGSFLLINNLIGMGLGPLLMGFLSEELKASYGADALRYGAVFCLGFYVLAGILALLAARHVRKGWVD
ncbi:putative MFS family arabinose efflux permease [Sphingomonas leidyi]|uniref:Putative MFS family arabinose efflux permease n=2 Tax=Pseudomonadota TaxID=1224 RepID=A0A7X5V1L7_9SPHN|nr:MFS transporter [Sphingomonas leidyi]NIJ65875.1 putative MFS family arabinose efflux permease [Sphingomonas leidyi]